jgi:endonuclease/exonuclease/phosphatase family metal-dependent hydrolase
MDRSGSLRVMSFNVRQMDGDDGPNDWEHRKDLLVETIRMYSPDLLGTQEIFARQAAYIRDGLRHYQSFGRGRFGDNRDKHNTIFYDSRRFTLVKNGDLWFSRTPEVPGSADWGIPRPRIVTWGRLQQSEGPELLILNTHLPYGPDAEEARRCSAQVVLQAIAELPSDLPLFLTGDFNAPADGEIYVMLTAGLDDAWKTAVNIIGPECTLNGFGRVSARFATKRIDWILHRNAGQTMEVETVTHSVNGLYPSDHYPVVATFRQ